MKNIGWRLAWLSGVSLLGTQPLLAQAAPSAPDLDDPDSIVVTASRIPRGGVAPIEPTIVLGAGTIRDRGYTNLADALNEIPQFGVAGSTPIGSQTGLEIGQNFANFFNLGSQRTLTLVNGRRFVSSNTISIAGPTDSGSQVDLNLIPETMIDRVEIVTVGGAPIYGSDAIAGTVNVILKRDFDGLRIEGTNGISQRGDLANHRLSATAGKRFADGRGSIILSGEWQKRAGLTTADRTLTSSAGPFFGLTNTPGAGYTQQLYYGLRYDIFTPYGMPMFAPNSIPALAGIRNSAGQLLAFNRAGQLVPFNAGTQTGSILSSAGGDGFAVQDYDNLIARNERYLATAQASFKISDGARLFGEGWYSRSRSVNALRQPYYNSALFGAAGAANGNLIISLYNPFLSAADRATIAANLPAGQTAFALSRASTDLQDGRTSSLTELYRFVGGIDGDFRIGDKPWHYEATLNYGHSRTVSESRAVVFQNLRNALNAVVDGSGQIVCAPGYTNAPITTGSATCSPFNPFGQSDTAMQRAAIDYITALARTTSVNTQLVGNLNVRGSLFTLPGGDVQAVLGYEHRREHASFDPGAYYYGQTLPNGTRAGYGNAVPVNFASGTFDTNEGFAELHAPIVSADMGWRFVNRLELEAAARYVHNSLSGGGWTYTLGGSLAPVEGLTFRGNFTHSIRSPSLAEAYSPRSSATDSGADPCDVRYIASGPNPGRRAANCAAGGVPANLVSNFASASVPVTVEGNPNLRNEQANSYTFGAVVAPRFAPGLTVSADYVNITLKDAIRRLTGSQILNACYDAASFPSSYCGLITRNAAGQITGIEEGYYNLASAKVKALSAELRYAFDLARLGLKGEPGGIEFDFNFYHLIDQYSRVGTGDVDHTVGEVGNPRNSFTATLGYRRKAFDVQWQTQYYGPSRFDADAAPGTYEYPGVKHWYLFNASVGTTVARAFDLRLIVNNVLDSAPPFPAPAGSGTITYFSGLVGRAFELSFGAKF